MTPKPATGPLAALGRKPAKRKRSPCFSKVSEKPAPLFPPGGAPSCRKPLFYRRNRILRELSFPPPFPPRVAMEDYRGNPMADFARDDWEDTWEPYPPEAPVLLPGSEKKEDACGQSVCAPLF